MKYKIKGFKKIVIDLPKRLDASFADSLGTIIVERTTESWNFWYGLLKDFFAKEGHTRTHAFYKTEGGFLLGNWVSKQRKFKKSLSPEKISRLDDLNFVWDANETDWEGGFSHLKEYKH